MEDLIQIGSIGLLKAIDKFDLSYDVRFSTYAVPMIAGEIKRFLRDDGMIKVSRPLKELAEKSGRREKSWRRTSGGSRQWRSLQGRWEPAVRRLRHPWKLGRESDPSTSFDAGDESGGCLADKIAEKTSENDRVLDRIVLAELYPVSGRRNSRS